MTKLDGRTKEGRLHKRRSEAGRRGAFIKWFSMTQKEQKAHIRLMQEARLAGGRTGLKRGKRKTRKAD